MTTRVGKANGQGTCGDCDKPIPKGEKQLIEESYMRSIRKCKNCFLKIFANVFSEELQDDNFMERLRAIIMLNNLEKEK